MGEADACAAGSSPRMRGARRGLHGLKLCAGIIPAYAGSTKVWVKLMPVRRDHPRVCGEHHVQVHAGARLQGSSPRMRGAPAVFDALQDKAGIIPAYAGSTSCSRPRWSAPKDHPRVCGEHRIGLNGFLFMTGSSPRMRGAPARSWSRKTARRIIPAYAGSTGLVRRLDGRDEDHPRVCGEHLNASWAMVSHSWIIPAYAGSTSPSRSRFCQT